MLRNIAALAVILAGSAAAQTRTAKPVTMPIDAWATLAPAPSHIASPKLDTTPAPDNAEQITVFARANQRDEEWRAELAGQIPAYEAINSEAAQPVLPFPQWSSAEQERLMSLKTDALGLCGALGGYIQCPNKAP
jgi:hypothetical protein